MTSLQDGLGQVTFGETKPKEQKNMKTRHLLACVAGFALAVSQTSANLIVNGDFQSGNTDFSTDYSSTLGIGGTEGTYAVVNNPHGPAPSHNPWATSYYDHTYGTASGLMMAVNGATVPGKTVWGQSMSGLTVGQQYEFSLWLSSWVVTSGAGNAVLDIKIDGLSQAVLYAPTTAGVWERRSFAWTAAASEIAFAAIFDTEIAVYPNDFALDDIALAAFSGQHLDELGGPGVVIPGPVIPEPSTYLAGALLLLPFGFSAVRHFRSRRQAA